MILYWQSGKPCDSNFWASGATTHQVPQTQIVIASGASPLWE